MLAFYIAGAVITYAVIGGITWREMRHGVLNWLWAMAIVSMIWPVIAVALIQAAWTDRDHDDEI